MIGSTSLYGRLQDGLRREAKKAAVLTFLVAILGVMWARMAMKDGAAPNQAVAVTTLAGSGKTAKGAGSVGRGAEATSAFKTWLNAPLAPINRNLFSVDLNYYPTEGSRTESKQGAPGFWGELAKSVSEKADVTKERQILLENLQQQASQLRLQTTVMGMKPKAVVNGELVGIGDVVASGTGEARTTFRVLKIESRRIIVEREGIKLAVPMKQ
jgi:hypothetical protein